MKFLDAIFQGGLKLIGLAETQIANVVKVGAFVRGLNLPPATHPGVYADLLKLIGVAEDQVPKIQTFGNQLAQYGSAIQVLEGAQAEFAAGQPVTGSVKIGAVMYDYSFMPRSQSAPPAPAPAPPAAAQANVSEPAAAAATIEAGSVPTTPHGDELTPIEARTATGGP